MLKLLWTQDLKINNAVVNLEIQKQLPLGVQHVITVEWSGK